MTSGTQLYLIAKQSFNSFEEVEKLITETAGLHLHDEDRLIVSREQVVFISRFGTQEKREAKAVELQERLRIPRNAAIPGYKRQVLERRKEKRLWEWTRVNSLCDERKKAVFPKGASRELIDKCGPTMEVLGR